MEGRAVEVTHKDHKYVVDGNKNITSVTTGKVMAWGNENGDRKAILGLAEQQFRSIVYNTQRSVSFQLVTHLRKLGFEVYGKEALEQYLKEHSNALNQQAVGKLPNNSQLTFAKGISKPEEGVAGLSTAIMTQANTYFQATDKLSKENGNVIKKIIFYGNNIYLWSTENGYEFFVEQSLLINESNYNVISHLLRTYGTSARIAAALRNIEKLRNARERKRRYIELAQQEGNNIYTSTNSGINGQQRLESSNRTGTNENTLANPEGKEVDLDAEDSVTHSTAQQWNDDFREAMKFTTPSGEVYGFVTKDGKIYLDETAISPEHPIHEYTHIWDRIVAQKNPKLWKRGVELMRELDLWKKIEENENYGKKWMERGITGERLENLIASEVHSRLVGQEGEALLNKVAQKKGHEGIVDKLKNWMLDVWKVLKGTFSNWSDKEIAQLTLNAYQSPPPVLLTHAKVAHKSHTSKFSHDFFKEFFFG